MKKFSFSIILLLCLIIISACSGYKPIFGTSNLKVKIVDYSIAGDQRLGKEIYTRLYILSKSNENSPNTKNIYILINSTQNKNATAKNTAGKVLGYRINLSTSIIAKDLSTGDELLNENFSFSLTYKTQDEFFETKKLENQTVENLVNLTYQDLLIKLTNSLL